MGYSCEWSPLQPDRIAVATAQWFGLVGNGKQEIFSLAHPGTAKPLKLLKSFDTQEGCFDCAWAENNENLLLSCCGDGTLKIWDLKSQTNPLRSFSEHRKEVYSVSWNPTEKCHFLSGSWDNTIKLWDPLSHQSIRTWQGHNGVLYKVVWSPRNQTEFASVAEDCYLNIWDSKQVQPAMRIRAHDHEMLACDYCKHNADLIATGSTIGEIKVWDKRRLAKPLYYMKKHRYAVRNLEFSPHYPNVLLSTSYDMLCILWQIDQPNPVAKVFNHHCEFVLSSSFNLFRKGMVATTGWDQSVCIFNVNGESPPQVPKIPIPRIQPRT